MDFEKFRSEYDQNYQIAKKEVQEHSIWLFLSAISAYSLGPHFVGYLAQIVVLIIFFIQLASRFFGVIEERKRIQELNAHDREKLDKYRLEVYPHRRVFFDLKIYIICIAYIVVLYGFGEDSWIYYLYARH